MKANNRNTESKMRTRIKYGSLIAVFAIIFLYVICLNSVYVWYVRSISDVNLYITSTAFGAIIVGFIADKWKRRYTLILSFCLSLPLLFAVYWIHSTYLLIAIGIILNPLPIVRATLIDNLHDYSKIRLIAMSFAVQFIPAALYARIYALHHSFQSFYLALASLILMLFFALVLFHDDMDTRSIKSENNWHSFFQSEFKKRGFYTLLAYIPTQFVFLLADSSLELSKENPLVWSTLGGGVIVGALIAMLYKKTPHTSVLTISYGLSFVASVVPIIGVFLYDIAIQDPTLQMIIYSAEMGFYLPFVYDVILRAVRKSYRSTACGVIDFISCIAYFTSLLYFDFFKVEVSFILFAISICFFMSIFLQKAAENH